MDSRPETISCVSGEKVFGRFLHYFSLKTMERIGMEEYISTKQRIYMTNL